MAARNPHAVFLRVLKLVPKTDDFAQLRASLQSLIMYCPPEALWEEAGVLLYMHTFKQEHKENPDSRPRWLSRILDIVQDTKQALDQKEDMLFH